MIYDKPFRTYDEQLDKIKSVYKLNANNEEYALSLLSNISYYTLINGYKDCFMVNGTFIENLVLEEVFFFHDFDAGIQNILFKYSLYAENAFKSKLAYVLSKNMGVHHDDYLNIRNYETRDKQGNRFPILVKLLKNLNKKATECYDNPTKYYIDKHNHVPPWILLRNARFADSINLYSFLKATDKNEVCQDVLSIKNLTIEDLEVAKKSISIIKYYRNLIAHRMKFVTNRSPDLLPEGILEKLELKPNFVIDEDEFKGGLGRSDMFSYIISINILLNDKFLKYRFIYELVTHIESFCENENLTRLYNRYLKVAGLPLDFNIRLKNLLLNIINE
jgi:abortive infection bacteriophage resistance protein